MLDQPVVGGKSCRVCKILQVEFNVTRDRNHGCEKTLWIFHIFNPPQNAWWRRTRGMGKCPLSKIPISLLASQVLRFAVFLRTSISSHCFGDKNKKWSSQGFDEIWNPLDYSEVATLADRSKLNLVPSPWGKDFDEFPTILNLHTARVASN